MRLTTWCHYKNQRTLISNSLTHRSLGRFRTCKEKGETCQWDNVPGIKETPSVPLPNSYLDRLVPRRRSCTDSVGK